MSDQGHDPFYVGYFPLPARDRRFLRWMIPMGLLAVAGLGLLVGVSQRDPGVGRWDIDKEIVLEGRVSVDPYALLHTRDGALPRAVLLVEEGKFGAAERFKALHGKSAKIRGTLLHREGRSMLEISGSGDAVTVLGDSASASPVAISLGPQAIRGEVIDPKCYIGAMKPGGGKTHKACAELCLAGGIPPMLATWDASGHEVFYLLMLADGTPANAAAARVAGEIVMLSGAVEKRDDLLVLRLGPDALGK
jgi:hypothetical protein